MDFVLWMAGLALRICLVVAGFWVFKAILKDGPETLKEVLKTLDVLLRTGCLKLRQKIAENLRKERLEKQTQTADVEAEGSVK